MVWGLGFSFWGSGSITPLRRSSSPRTIIACARCKTKAADLNSHPPTIPLHCGCSSHCSFFKLIVARVSRVERVAQCARDARAMRAWRRISKCDNSLRLILGGPKQLFPTDYQDCFCHNICTTACSQLPQVKFAVQLRIKGFCRARLLFCDVLVRCLE